MYICICRQVSSADITTAINKGCKDLKQLKDETQFGTQCGKCVEKASCFFVNTKVNSTAKVL